VWSEENPFYALYNLGETDALSAIGLLDVRPGSAAQKREGEQYIEAAAAGHRDTETSLHKYVESQRGRVGKIAVSASPDGMVAVEPCMTVYLRELKGKIFGVLSSKHETSFEIDAHPVIYFVVFPALEGK
jgi:hypothetical protein